MKETLGEAYHQFHLRHGKYGFAHHLTSKGNFYREEIGTDKKVLDLGCRDGMMTSAFAEGNQLTCIDVDQTGLRRCAEKLQVNTIWHDINEPLPFNDANFDVVIVFCQRLLVKNEKERSQIMKIVFWTVSHLPDIGGFQWSTFRLAKALKRLGHEVLFLTATAENSSSDGIVEAVRISTPDIPEWTTESGLWLLDNASQFDVIHAIDLFYRSIGKEFDFLHRSGLPSVIKIPTMGCIPRLIASPELKHQLSMIDAVVSLSEGIRSELLAVGVEYERIYSIPNGVSCDEFVPSQNKEIAKRSLGFAESDVVILYAGRLVGRKRIDVLLKASQRLAGEARVVLMGSGFDIRDSTEEEMLGLARSITNVSIVGAQENTLAYYQASDIHILLSEREGQPNSVLEGMSCALPTIATDIQGISNLITDGVEGILVDVGDVDGTVSALKKLIHNPELRSIMGKAGREKVLRQFEIGIIADQYAELYRSLIGKRKGE